MTKVTSDLTSQIKNKYQEIKRLCGEADIVAVTKYGDHEQVRAAYRAGLREFGENRVMDLFDKAQRLIELEDLRWHFIGNLQKNKINKLLQTPHLSAIHSIDSFELLAELCKKMSHFKGEELAIYLQVNTSGEEQKSGASSYNELFKSVELLLNQPRTSALYFKGLMTMSGIRNHDFESRARESFQLLAKYRQRLASDFDLDEQSIGLSMGMSRDYPIALEEGATHLRLGSVLFPQD